VILVTGALFASRQRSSRAADVPLLETPAWQGGAPRYGDDLLLRRAMPGDAALLLKHSAHNGGYRYDGRTRTLSAIAEEEWGRAGGPAAECGTQGPPLPQVLRIDQQSHTLLAEQRQIPTAGATALVLVESPSHRYVAVLSAAGPARPSLLPFLGSGAAEGQRVHQLVSLPDATITGNPIGIPVKSNEDVLAACWSPDEKAIVYHDVLFTHVSVVEL